MIHIRTVEVNCIVPVVEFLRLANVLENSKIKFKPYLGGSYLRQYQFGVSGFKYWAEEKENF